MKYFSVDRIINQLAVCQWNNGEFFKIEISKLPKNVRETDCICVDDFGNYYINNTLTDLIKKENADLEKSVFGEK